MRVEFEVSTRSTVSLGTKRGRQKQNFNVVKFENAHSL